MQLDPQQRLALFVALWFVVPDALRDVMGGVARLGWSGYWQTVDVLQASALALVMPFAAYFLVRSIQRRDGTAR